MSYDEERRADYESKKKTILESVSRYKDEIGRLVDRQTLKGHDKYGRTVTQDTSSALYWLDHMIEEQIDGLVYALRLRDELVKEVGYARD